ncbi:hypothetical protein [Lacticaseibacillus suilingensis]|uniref:hypothetical protein n=1 Tax=Lacticaseibacillus suilingensis TaxID=2799577 RepID=UPI0022E2FC19|nr:hypothetical protein [Lacticaseibacillus suilingensis]
MSNETKRDVFEDAIFWAGKSLYTLHDTDYAEGILGGLRARYAAAIPDDLPVIPKAVGEYIKWGKTYGIAMYMMFSFKFVRSQEFRKLTDEVEDWIISNSDAFAIAWLLGVWCIEETGEVVKL